MKYLVTCLPTAQEQYLAIQRAAESSEFALSIRKALQDTLTSLGKDAANVGEPLYDLKQMKMRVCRILVPPLYVEYGVHFTKPIAFIRRVVLLRKPL